jgi:hypothetical protein
MSERYIKQKPFVDDRGIHVPINEYVQEGCASTYVCIMPKELFVEAYNKWIKGKTDVYCDPFIGQDDADCWCD